MLWEIWAEQVSAQLACEPYLQVGRPQAKQDAPATQALRICPQPSCFPVFPPSSRAGLGSFPETSPAVIHEPHSEKHPGSYERA